MIQSNPQCTIRSAEGRSDKDVQKRIAEPVDVQIPAESQGDEDDDDLIDRVVLNMNQVHQTQTRTQTQTQTWS